jgi:hypothetical protein
VLAEAPASIRHAPARGAVAYQRHLPEATLLYRIVQEHWLDFLAEIETGGGQLPAFVRDEFAAYLRCGIPAHGFLRVRCADCGHSRVVAFSCRRRGFCPSCLGRRMADTAAFCVDHLFPRAPVRQWVLSVPYRLRFQMAYAPRLASAVLRAFIAAVTGDLRRRARKRGIRGHLQTGSQTVVQRFGSALGLNVHFHSIVLDGVYASTSDGSWLFHPLPAPADQDVARVARAVSRKVSRLLARQRPAAEEQGSLLDDLANASVQGLVATGRRRGCRVLRLGTGEDVAEAAITSRRCAEVAGFNVHANVRVHANDRDGLEHLVKYLARPPIANDRLSELPDGRLALALKHRWRDGTTHVVFTPHELIEKLIPLIPRPRAHLVRYHGILGPAAKDRAKVVPRFLRPGFGRSPASEEPREIDPRGMPRLGRLPWAVLLKRVFLVDVLECPKCQGRMKIVAVVTAPASVRRVLEHLGLPSEAPRPRPARSPPQLDLTEGRGPSDAFYPDPPSPDW